MNKIKALFIGMYPNAVDKYKNVFFQNLIFAISNLGVDCTVISPVSILKYGNKVKNIPKMEMQETLQGNKVRVYYPRYISASAKNIFGFNTHIITEKNFEKAVLKKIKELDEKFDFSYGHFFLEGGIAAVKAGKMLEIPSFIAFGECDYETQIQATYGDLKKNDIDGLSGVIAVSTKNKCRLEQLGIFNDIPIVVEPNAIDKDLFFEMDKSECRKKLNLPLDKFIVGFVGGFIERKGDKRLLEAINQIDNDVFVAFAGKGDNPPAGNKVVFCQALDHNDVPLFLNSMDIFCLPTLSEGSCNAVIEALACGVPVISSDCEFNDDVLDHLNSIRINPNSVEEIRDAILKIYSDKEMRVKLHDAALEVGKRLTIDSRAKRILDFIEKCSDR